MMDPIIDTGNQGKPAVGLYPLYITESSPRGERIMDINSLLMRERIVMLNLPINDQVANYIISQLLYLDKEDPDKDISLYINSPGGVVTAGLAIYDTMQLIRPDVSTICLGMAASMATILLCAGAKGKRYALPHATIHMHQVLGGAQGQASDVVIAAKEIMRLDDIIKGIMVKHTEQPMEKITHDTDRDFYLNPQQALEYGLIDQILEKSGAKKENKAAK
jgi:ATP-dependent Clp protease, protease subunit